MTSFAERASILRRQFFEDLQAVQGSQDVERLRLKFLSKKGPVQALVAELRVLDSERRSEAGRIANELKLEITSALEDASATWLRDEQDRRLSRERIDVTLPGRPRPIGRPHPLRLVLERTLDIFVGMGFSIQYGPDIDSDYYNFEGLNYPKDHPARAMQDTFYIAPDLLLRSHTSNTELHLMESSEPPIRVVIPGTCYRNETVSARAHVFFHQVEGMYIDRGVSLADLFATFRTFLERFFGQETKARFRPSFFPFVEPGVEVDIACTLCRGKGCRLCKQSGWLEIAGAGMSHPEVLKNGGIDPELYTGFAWGMGVERLAMLWYAIEDIRTFSENDLRFLSQFHTQ